MLFNPRIIKRLVIILHQEITSRFKPDVRVFFEMRKEWRAEGVMVIGQFKKAAGCVRIFSESTLHKISASLSLLLIGLNIHAGSFLFPV